MSAPRGGPGKRFCRGTSLCTCYARHVRERGGKRRSIEPQPPAESVPFDPPEGLRVFRGTAESEEYAVLVVPAASGERAGESRASLGAAEREVVDLVLAGLPNDAIAARRGTSARTVANQLQSIYRKLGVASRFERATALGRSKR